MTTEEFRTTWEHTIEIPVAWGEMDALGHVNNIMYFRYLETARVDFLNKLSTLIPLPHGNAGPILAYIDAQFRVPVTFPDTVIVGSRIDSIGTTSVKMSQTIYSTVHQAVALESKSVIVIIKYDTGEKVPVPDVLKEKYG